MPSGFLWSKLRQGLGHTKLSSLLSLARRSHGADRYAALAALARAAAPGYLGDGWAAAEARVFSQNGEDGVLAALFGRIGTGTRRFVEFGIQDGREGNAVLLADVAGWSGLFLEADRGPYERLEQKYRHSATVRTRLARVEPENFDRLLAEEGFDGDLDLLSIDVDGDDWWIWRATTARPRVVVIEYNAALGLDARVAPRRSAGWDGTDGFGASLTALEALGRRKGYGLVHCDLAGVNAFFVRQDVASEAGLRIRSAAEVYRPANYGLEGRRHPPGPSLSWIEVGPDGEPALP